MGVTATDIAQIPMSPELAATLARGAEFAGGTGAPEVSLEHLLAALCDDPDALAVLDASHISSERIKGDVISRVLQNAEQHGVPQDSLGVSTEVRRILEAAAAASRGSRRRDINGAIVLAAIVGDARSVAAEILEAHGLTFENAIRALQSALQPPREPTPPPAAQPPVADDVLARARERVQSRSAPSLREIMKDLPRPVPPAPHPVSEEPAQNEPPFEPPLSRGPSLDMPAEATAPLPDIVPSQPFEPNFDSGPIGPPAPHSFDIGTVSEQSPFGVPKTEPPRTESWPSRPAAGPAPGPAPAPQMPTPAPATAPEPRFSASHDPNAQRPEPSFGTQGPGSGQGPPATNPASFPSEPSLPLPARPSHPQSETTGPRQEGPAFPLPFPSQGIPPVTQPGTAGPPPGAAPAPPREMFDLPPRPQPSRVQPPPIPPAPGLGGPRMPGPRPASPGAMPPQQGASPQFGAPGPSLSHGGPMAGPHAPVGAPTGVPGPRPNPGQDTAFRPGQPPASAPAPQQPAAQPRRVAKRSKGAPVETGQLAENIPRAMRVGKTVRAEVRIAKASIKALTDNLDGGGQVWQHSVAVTRAMSVRLRAPDGGFFIESASPETQWIEGNLGYSSDDFASWRFLITPQYRGWSDLQIIVSARTVGTDGVAAETALPDQIVEVKVRANIGRALARVVGWTIAAVIGGALATFGETGMTIGTALLKKFGH